jgi:hypothetical protein
LVIELFFCARLFLLLPLAAFIVRGMKKQLTYVAPLKAGIVLAVLYFVGGLIGAVIALPFLLFARALAEASVSAVSPAWLFLMPIGYGILGFIVGVIAAALYNLVAKFTGGIEFELKDVPSPPTTYAASASV